MKKEADFLTTYRQEMPELKQIESPELAEYGREELRLLVKLIETRKSQFQERKNDEKYRLLVDEFYPSLYEIARVQEGHIILDINEETLLGTLTYIGNELFLDEDLRLSDFTVIVSAADNVCITTEDKRLKIQMFFDLFDRIQVADYSEEISKVKEEIRRHRDGHSQSDQ